MALIIKDTGGVGGSLTLPFTPDWDWSAESGVTINTSTGRVSDWVDQSTNAFTASQSTDSNRPTMGVHNSKPYLYFNGSNYLSTAHNSLFNLGSGQTIFLVCAVLDSGVNANVGILGHLSGASSWYVISESAASDQLIYPSNSTIVNGGDIDDDQWKIISLKSDPTNTYIEIRINGSLIASNSSATFGADVTTDLLIGGYSTGNTGKTRIKHIIGRASALSGTTISDSETALNDYYSVY